MLDQGPFINAIHAKQKVRVTFVGNDGQQRVRLCAPMDYGPSRRAKNPIDRFHAWNYESPDGPHVLSVKPDQMLGIDVLTESFDPAEFVTWQSDWIVPRDWGPYS